MVDPNGKGDGEELKGKGIQGQETIIRMFCKKNVFSLKDKIKKILDQNSSLFSFF